MLCQFQKTSSSTIPVASAISLYLALLSLSLLPLRIQSFTCLSTRRSLIPTIQRTSSTRNSSTSLSSSITETREKLIQKAKEIDPSLLNSNKGSYCNVGWSNRLGAVLTPVSTTNDDEVDGTSSTVYEACRPFYWNKIDVGGRMTVIELPNKKNAKPDLFIHSPVQLDKSLQDALQILGNVKYVVSPNYEHVKYAKSWDEAYPDAYMIACPGMMEREPDVNWTNEIPYGYRPSSFFAAGNDHNGDDNKEVKESLEGMWDYDIIQPLHINLEVNPFTNKSFFNEVVFYHKPTKTLLTTDLFWNYPNGDGVTNSNYKSYGSDIDANTSFDWELAPSVEKIPFGTKLWKIGMDQLFRPFYLNLMIKSDQKEEFQQVASFISGINTISAWDVETVVPCHGDVLCGPKLVRQVLRNFFNVE